MWYFNSLLLAPKDLTNSVFTCQLSKFQQIFSDFKFRPKLKLKKKKNKHKSHCYFLYFSPCKKVLSKLTEYQMQAEELFKLIIPIGKF